MTDHLSIETLNALADGELTADQLVRTNEHLAMCPSCTSSALFQTMLKAATARAGQRYIAPSDLQGRVARIVSQASSQLLAPESRSAPESTSRSEKRFGFAGRAAWAVAAMLLLASISIVFIGRNAQRTQLASEENAALITEACDQHISALAASTPLQVLSTDRHTVKPWFQGKIPFSFNLPEGLPNDTALDGANLTYLHNQPVAQLLYSIGRHRVSVFLRQRSGSDQPGVLSAEHAGFHVTGFSTEDLDVVAVSDVDSARLSDLVGRIEHAQTGYHGQAK
jgi:anti-sigma factor RsiW